MVRIRESDTPRNNCGQHQIKKANPKSFLFNLSDSLRSLISYLVPRHPAFSHTAFCPRNEISVLYQVIARHVCRLRHSHDMQNRRSNISQDTVFYLCILVGCHIYERNRVQ